MILIIRTTQILFALVLIMYGAMGPLLGQGVSRWNITALVIGVILLFLLLFNGGRRLFSDPDDHAEKDAAELMHDLTWRNMWRYLLMHFGFVGAISDTSSQKLTLQARKERVAAARRKMDFIRTFA